QFDVDIDFAAKKLNLFSQDHCAGKVVYWAADAVTVVPMHVVNSGHIMVPVTLDGHGFDAMLDTGSSHTHLSQESARNIFGLAPDSAGMAKVGDFGPGGKTAVYRHSFGALALQGITIGNPGVYIFEDLLRTGMAQTPHLGSRLTDVDVSDGVTDMILGMSELQNLHVYIAYKEQKLYISSASSPSIAAGGGSPAAPATTAAAH
ncbi:MAG TPA: aspartyl protease family protein, partial [Rhizomicrobium sp.]